MQPANDRFYLKPLLVSFVGAALALSGAGIRAQDMSESRRPPLNSSRAASEDSIAHLLQRLASGEVVLSGSDQEILRTVLRELKIPIESQLAVFSRTSAQAGLIRPAHPRALYFSDSVYVGWVPGGLIEAVAIDPATGPVFYAFDPQDARAGRRTFVQEKSCQRCHGDVSAPRVVGLFARSTITDATGEPLLPQRAGENMDDTMPFERRWAGWYVTGYAGKQTHRGNAFGRLNGSQTEFLSSEKRPTTLADYFDPTPYLTTTSDVVALLVFEHEIAVHNSLTRAAREWRRAIEEQRVRQKAAEQPVINAMLDDITKEILTHTAQDVLDHLLFRDAAPLPEGVKGHAGFLRAFAADARRSSHGDALKDLSLHGRLFANRCSFLIYSDAFNALPAPLKDRVLDDLSSVLHEEEPTGRYAYLESEEKRRISEVLIETHPDARRQFLRPRN